MQMKNYAFVSCLLALISVSAVAQEAPKFYLSGGYAFVRQTNDQFNMNGFDLSGAYFFSHNVGIKGDVSRAATGIDKYTFFMFGPEARFHKGRAEPFFHLLFGALRNSYGGGVLDLSTTQFEYGVGAGLDAVVAPKIAVRVIQADLLSNRRSSMYVYDNTVFLRISAGLSVRF